MEGTQENRPAQKKESVEPRPLLQPPPRGKKTAPGRRPLAGARHKHCFSCMSLNGPSWRFWRKQFLTLARHSFCRCDRRASHKFIRNLPFNLGWATVCCLRGRAAPASYFTTASSLPPEVPIAAGHTFLNQCRATEFGEASFFRMGKHCCREPIDSHLSGRCLSKNLCNNFARTKDCS